MFQVIRDSPYSESVQDFFDAIRITAPNAAVQVETPRAIWISKITVYSSDDG
jgi:hypothetical protein